MASGWRVIRGAGGRSLGLNGQKLAWPVAQVLQGVGVAVQPGGLAGGEVNIAEFPVRRSVSKMHFGQSDDQPGAFVVHRDAAVRPQLVPQYTKLGTIGLHGEL